MRQRVRVDKRFIHFEKGLVARGADPRSAPTKLGPDAWHGAGTRVPQWLLLLLLLRWHVTGETVTMTAVVVVVRWVVVKLLRITCILMRRVRIVFKGRFHGSGRHDPPQLTLLIITAGKHLKLVEK